MMLKPRNLRLRPGFGKKHGRGLLALWAIPALLLTFLWISDASADISPDSETQYEPAPIAYEIVEERDANKKVYMLTDGQYMVEMCGGPIHYQDENGDWIDIDSTITENNDDKALQGYQYRNTDNAFTVYFSDMADGKAVLMEMGDYAVSFAPVSAKQDVDAAPVGELQWTDQESLPEYMKEDCSVIYLDVAADTDIAYTTNAEGVKRKLY
jgi:hypothetical protein